MHGDTLDDTCIVNENVDIAHLRVDLLNERLYSVLIGYVTYITLHVLDASLLIVSQTTLQRLFVDVVEDGLDTCGYESLGDVETNSVRGTSDPGVLTFQ